MANGRREIRIYETKDGRIPFGEWMDELAGSKVYAIILNRLDRVEKGNLGDCHPLGEGVSELRIDFGPGYRIYFGQDGSLIILLGGGTKRTQADDIKRAKRRWKEYHA
jgi:putative addiction module killer protein